MKIILASASPRRRELMELLGFKDIEIIPARGEETPPENAGPEKTVETLSAAKAEEVARLCGGDDAIIAADTVVWLDGEIFGKPADAAQAAEMLRRLSGRSHRVYTGVTVRRGELVLTRHEMTTVRFRGVSEGEISAYIATGEPMDKAGAYAAQGIGSVFVEGIEGDFFNVMGLPLCTLARMLKTIGVVVL